MNPILILHSFLILHSSSFILHFLAGKKGTRGDGKGGRRTLPPPLGENSLPHNQEGEGRDDGEFLYDEEGGIKAVKRM
jgi:hypothetical protein